jgi:serine/threonine protein kinase
VKAFAALHHMKIFHRDIKTANILVAGTKNANIPGIDVELLIDKIVFISKAF